MTDDATTAVFIDGSDALAAIIVRPNADGTGLQVEAWANGITHAEAARIMRYMAEKWENEP